MLRGIRTASANWLGRIVMGVILGLIAISFAIWGIGDIFRGFGRSSLARIGNTEVSIEQFRQQYNDRLQQLSRQLSRPITLDMARKMGLDRQIVAQLFAEVTLDERAKMLKLGISDAEIVRRVMAEPGFRGPDGRFDRVRFEQIIRQSGLTEQRYVAEQRRELLRRQLVSTILNGTTLPKAAVDALDRYQNEQRSIDYVLLDRSRAGEIEPPTPEVLAKYYEERKALFRAPEYRKITLLTLLPSEQAPWIEISNEELKRLYEERRSRYSTPERRTLQQIVFPNADDARAAAEKIAKGASFPEIAKARGLSEKDLNLGTLAKASIVDRAVADAAFALKEGEVSAPVTGRFGTVLIRVVKIEPEHVRPFEEVAAELKRAVAIERAKSQILSMYDKIEDERSLGRTLAEAAKTVKLGIRTIEVDRSGRDPSGVPVGNLPDAQRLLTTAFSTDAGVENDPLQFDGGYIWYEITDTTPSHERPLEEVKKQVEERWRTDEIAARLRTAATKLVDKLKIGTPFAEVATAEKLKIETRTNIKRESPAPPLSDRTIDAIFTTAKDAYGNGPAADGVEQIVFRITDIVAPKTAPDSEEHKRLVETLNRSYGDDVFTQYLTQIERRIGVTINENALRQVVTGQSTADN
ncbi:MAG: peptidyl-prolyl cis-trans isomerase [Xanthobacteraceae bacterium]